MAGHAFERGRKWHAGTAWHAIAGGVTTPCDPLPYGAIFHPNASPAVIFSELFPAFLIFINRFLSLSIRNDRRPDARGERKVPARKRRQTNGGKGRRPLALDFLRRTKKSSAGHRFQTDAYFFKQNQSLSIRTKLFHTFSCFFKPHGAIVKTGNRRGAIHNLLPVFATPARAASAHHAAPQAGGPAAEAANGYDQASPCKKCHWRF
ncbi:MAG TPA: hypothetical protein VD973_12040 [Symbiobacteriaceae bacterium]|nr:hypothetical protein [Symbiobacteriaceae bacterium]